MARKLVRRLVADLGRNGAHQAVDAMLARLSVLERAALAVHWPLWARSKQLAPNDDWRTWGFLTGRGFGKTLAIAHHIDDEVFTGRASLIGLAAQDEENSIAVQVLGPAGLQAVARPWFRPRWETGAKQLVWPNGARAIVRTPESPGKIRGLEYQLSWLSELQSWPRMKRDEAFSNFRISTRIGYGRILWDATPKRRHPILRQLLAEHEGNPRSHRIVRGSMYENADELGPGYIEDQESRLAGTRRGREEMLGEMLDDSEGALIEEDWIDNHRRPLPPVLERKVIGVDPSVTERQGSDKTGIIVGGRGADKQIYVIANRSGIYAAHRWADIVLDEYEKGCDLVVVETNKGGNLLVQNLRAAAKERGLQVIVVEEKWVPRRQAGIVFVREIYSKGTKEDRAEPTATAYKAGRVSHVEGGEGLDDLEDVITTWEPEVGARSPDELDALVQVVTELDELARLAPNPKADFRGFRKMREELSKPRQKPSRFVPRDGGGRI